MFNKFIRNIRFFTSESKISTLPNGIYSVNYHRIGDKNDTAFDPNVFSSSVKSFEEQLIFYKENFNVITAREASIIIETKDVLTEKYLIITFDDGYADNFNLAFPLILKHELYATFFIATDFINSGKIPWWDKVAYIIKQTKKNKIQLNELHHKSINLHNKEKAIRQILKLFKINADFSIDEKLSILMQNAQIEENLIIDDPNKPLFMNWLMINEMANKGMDIGSHTCSHQVLSHLCESKQGIELIESKRIIEDKINLEVVALAYPVGASTSYNLESSLGAKNAGYKIAFDFEKGINKSPLKGHEFELHRFPINYEHSLSDIITMFTVKQSA